MLGEQYTVCNTSLFTLQWETSVMEGRKEVNIIKLMHTYHFTQSHIVVNNSGCNLLEHVTTYKLMVTGKCKWVKHFDVPCIFIFLSLGKAIQKRQYLLQQKWKRSLSLKNTYLNTITCKYFSLKFFFWGGGHYSESLPIKFFSII